MRGAGSTFLSARLFASYSPSYNPLMGEMRRANAREADQAIGTRYIPTLVCLRHHCCCANGEGRHRAPWPENSFGYYRQRCDGAISSGSHPQEISESMNEPIPRVDMAFRELK
jgi:hypothetical protein